MQTAQIRFKRLDVLAHILTVHYTHALSESPCIRVTELSLSNQMTETLG